jgi:phospholipase C
MTTPPPMSRRRRRLLATAGVAAATATLVATGTAASSAAPANHSGRTATPIKHIVVLFDENVSFDHYFATYPKAANTDGTPFFAAKHTPAANTLARAGLLTTNPNLDLPQRLSSSQAMTCDQNHGYTAEQKAVNNGAMDQFVQNTDVETCAPPLFTEPGLVMDYYDGNTVTALWNYAQHYAMSDNSWDTTFGPSTPGALNLVSGQTHGVQAVTSVTHTPVTNTGVAANPDANGIGTVVGDPDPAYDDCSDGNHTSTRDLAAAHGTNIGDLLNQHGVSWGWFQGGFAPTTAYAGSGTFAVCGATHANLAGATVTDYSPHHNPFSYYPSTANEHHVAPTGLSEIGHSGPANHNYDLTWFDQAVAQNKMPAVSFVKASEYQDGHAAYSDPTDEQHFLVHTINEIENSPEWSSTAIVIAYDDSDGWYDHVAPTILNGSNTSLDSTVCSTSTAPVLNGYVDRCGPSQRLPLLVVSPFARTNYVGHSYTEQTSIMQFIEDNWSTGRIGDGSFDARAGSLDPLFDFEGDHAPKVALANDGAVTSITPSH